MYSIPIHFCVTYVPADWRVAGGVWLCFDPEMTWTHFKTIVISYATPVYKFILFINKVICVFVSSRACQTPF